MTEIEDESNLRLRGIYEGAERFATHDPDIAWPGTAYENAVDAICATLDKVREEAAVLERSPKAVCQKLGDNVTVIRFADIEGMPEIVKGFRLVIVGDKKPGTIGPPARYVAVDASRGELMQRDVKIELYDGTRADATSGFIGGIAWAADELRSNA